MPIARSQAFVRGWRDGLQRHGATALLVVVALAGLTWRVDAALRVSFPSVDGVHYMHTARDLLRDGALPFSTFPPGWPLCIAAVAGTFGLREPAQMLLAAQALNVVAGTFSGVLVFLLVRRQVGAWWALLAASAYLLLPETVIASASDLSEMSYVATLLAAWLVFERRPSWIAGALFGFAYLVRPEALVVVAALLLRDLVREHRVRFAVAWGAAALVVPYVLFMRAATGAWMLSSKNAFLEDAVTDRSLLELVGQWVRNAWALTLPLWDVIGPVLIAFALLGVVLRRGPWLLGLLPVLLVPLFTFRMEARYWIPYLPFLLLSAMEGARWIVARWPRWRVQLSAVVVAGAVVGLAFAARGDWRFVGANFEFYPGMRAAGNWLAPRIAPGEVVADYKPYVAFWADAPFRKLPRGRDAAGVVDWARENGADYLVVNAHLVGSLTPELRPLLGELPPGLARKLTLVHVAEIEGDPRQTTLLYRVEPVGGRRTPGGSGRRRSRAHRSRFRRRPAAPRSPIAV